MFAICGYFCGYASCCPVVAVAGLFVVCFFCFGYVSGCAGCLNCFMRFEFWWFSVILVLWVFWWFFAYFGAFRFTCVFGFICDFLVFGVWFCGLFWDGAVLAGLCFWFYLVFDFGCV